MAVKTIFKYTLFPGFNAISLPKGAQPLSVGEQEYGCFLWALVDGSESVVRHGFQCVFTGSYLIENNGSFGNPVFIGTIHRKDGIVVHVFDHGEEKA